MGSDRRSIAIRPRARRDFGLGLGFASREVAASGPPGRLGHGHAERHGWPRACANEDLVVGQFDSDRGKITFRARPFGGSELEVTCPVCRLTSQVVSGRPNDALQPLSRMGVYRYQSVPRGWQGHCFVMSAISRGNRRTKLPAAGRKNSLHAINWSGAMLLPYGARGAAEWRGSQRSNRDAPRVGGKMREVESALMPPTRHAAIPVLKVAHPIAAGYVLRGDLWRLPNHLLRLQTRGVTHRRSS